MTPDTEVTLKFPGAPDMKTTVGKIKKATDRLQKKPPMKSDADWDGHNSKAFSVAGNELRQFIEQIESLEAEKKDIGGQIKEIYAESKARGYDTKAIRAIVALRKRDPDDVAEAQAILDIYKEALGMAA